MKKIILLILVCIGYLYPQPSNTIPRRVDTLETSVDSLYTKTSHIVKIEQYIGAYDTSLGWSLIVQAAVDDNLGDGNTLMFEPGKTYELEVQKVNPYRYSGAHKTCIDIGTGGFIFDLNGSTLRLKDGQQTDAGGSVDVIVGRAVRDFTLQNGSITGNTSGQTGWTDGYEQNDNGMLLVISSFTIDGKDNYNIVIDNIEFSDHFSNPFQILGGYDIRTTNIRVWGVGEGPEILGAHRIFGENIYVSDTSGVMVGDGLEYGHSFDVQLTNIIMEGSASAGGVAFELIGSDDVVVDGFKVLNWDAGFNNHGGYGNRIVFSNGIIKGIWGNAIYTNGYNMKFDNIFIDSCFIGVIAYSTVDSFSTFDNITFNNCPNPYFVYKDARLKITDNIFEGATNAITIVNQSRAVNDPSPILEISGSTFNNTTTAITINNQSDTSFRPTIKVLSSSFNNVTNILSNQSTTEDITFDGCFFEDYSTNATGGVLNVGGHPKVTVPIGNYISIINGGWRNMSLHLKFEQITEVRSYGATGSQIRLAKNYGEGFQEGDELFLEYDIENDKWYETNRIVFGNDAGKRNIIVDGWYYDNVDDSVSTSTTLYRFLTTLGNRFYVPYKCKIIGWGVFTSASVSADTLTMELWWGGVGPNKIIYLTSGTSKSTRYYRSSQLDLPAGQYIELKYKTGNSFAPTTLDIWAWIELEY